MVRGSVLATLAEIGNLHYCSLASGWYLVVKVYDCSRSTYCITRLLRCLDDVDRREHRLFPQRTPGPRDIFQSAVLLSRVRGPHVL